MVQSSILPLHNPSYWQISSKAPPSCCHVPPSWGSQALSSDAPPLQSLHFYWALLVLVTKVAMGFSLGCLFLEPGHLFVQNHAQAVSWPTIIRAKSLGLSYWNVPQNSRSQLSERICIPIPQKLNLCLKPHMAQGYCKTLNAEASLYSQVKNLCPWISALLWLSMGHSRSIT